MRSMREKHCLPHSGYSLTESGIWQSTAACLCLRAAARSYSSSKHDIPKTQVALLDARVSSLLSGMLHFLRIDLMWSLKRFFCPQTLLWPSLTFHKARVWVVCCQTFWQHSPTSGAGDGGIWIRLMESQPLIKCLNESLCATSEV